MGWLRLFGLLLAIATYITAEGPKKKIRIHLPQNVKHIHHHKKIYITNHPASTQYAPAFMPSAEGAVAVPTNVAMPAVTSILPLNSVELYEESQIRVPGMPMASSKLLPLYRSRGYYGPTNLDWGHQEFDLVPPPEPSKRTYIPTAFASSTVDEVIPRTPKKVKIVKINEPKRKNSGRKNKPQRIVVRGRTQVEDEHPVSTFHEMFYSDLDGTGTIRKIKKPQRVEKIIDGNTEHIHTYSEEHIHKLVFDEPKVTRSLNADPISGVSALTSAHQLIPFKNRQALIAISSGILPGFPTMGSLGTPTHLEYAAYNPRDVTHDHIFHDHGEIPTDMDLAKDPLAIPPKSSYNSQGLRVGGIPKGFKNKYSQKYNKPVKGTPSTDLTYYESIYTPYSRPKNIMNPTITSPQYDATGLGLDGYKPVTSHKQKDKGITKARNKVTPWFLNTKENADNNLPQANIPSPFSVSSSVVHDYKPKNLYGNLYKPSEPTKFKDPLSNFKENAYSNNLEYDTFASPSNLFTSEDKNIKSGFRKDKKKSFSTQNIHFGGLEVQKNIDNIEDFGISAISDSEDSPSAIEDLSQNIETKVTDLATSTPFTIKVTSPVHAYYSAMAVKAFQGDQAVADSSNNNIHYIQMQNPLTTPYGIPVTTTISSLIDNIDGHESNLVGLKPAEFILRKKARRRSKNVNSEDTIRPSRQKYLKEGLKHQVENINLVNYETKSLGIHGELNSKNNQVIQLSTASNLKYGDKI